MSKRKMKFGIFEVSYPTDKFISWLDNVGLRYELKSDASGHAENLIIQNYALGAYDGIVGLTATFEESPVLSLHGAEATTQDVEEEKNDTEVEPPTPSSNRTDLLLSVKDCDICNEAMKPGDNIVTMHQATVTAEVPDGLTVSEDNNVTTASHVEHIETTLGLDIVPPTPPALSADEKSIPGFGDQFERCILAAKAKGGAVNPYAVCRASLRRSHGLPVGKK